jgi:hypothetical protein
MVRGLCWLQIWLQVRDFAKARSLNALCSHDQTRSGSHLACLMRPLLP